MIQVIPSEQRYHTNMGWLDTRWHFSFDHYHDPANMGWSVLRVFNDDVIEPGQGFGTHPHRDMEIVSYVLEGALEHRDSLGSIGVIRAGEVQVMSAGTGITHSEHNHSKTELCHFLQLWIRPRTRGLTPRWKQRQFSVADRAGKLLPVVSGGHIPGTMTIDQDATVCLTALEPGQQVVHRSQPDRHAYLFVITGDLLLNGAALSPGDQARIKEESQLGIEARGNAEVIFLDLP